MHQKDTIQKEDKVKRVKYIPDIRKRGLFTSFLNLMNCAYHIQ
jgi:hypothetical protein